MKLSEVIDTNINLGNGETIQTIEVGKHTAQVLIEFTWDWNRESTEREITEFWVQKIELFDDGTEINLPAWQKVEISMFTYQNVNEDYLNKIIN